MTYICSAVRALGAAVEVFVVPDIISVGVALLKQRSVSKIKTSTLLLNCIYI